MPRGSSLTRYFVFSFCLPRCLARPLIIATDYRVPRVFVVCHHCEKGEGRKTDISCVQRKRRSVCRRIRKKEGEGTRVEEYEIKEAREDATVRRTERKSLYAVSWSCIRLCASYFHPFSCSPLFHSCSFCRANEKSASV